MIDSLRTRLRPLALWGAALACSAAAAAPGPADPVPATSAAFAAPAATVPAGMASRVLACTTCHGKEGRSTAEGYFPRIAGKPAGYLHNQLLNFRDGRRSYPQMGYLIEHLTDD